MRYTASDESQRVIRWDVYVPLLYVRWEPCGPL